MNRRSFLKFLGVLVAAIPGLGSLLDEHRVGDEYHLPAPDPTRPRHGAVFLDDSSGDMIKVHEFRVGDPEGDFILFDGETLTVSGSIEGSLS